eukprot:gene22652-biopygen11765
MNATAVDHTAAFMPHLCTHCHAKRAAVKLARLAHAAAQHALPHVLPVSTPQHSARRHPTQSAQHGRSACVSLNPWTGGVRAAGRTREVGGLRGDAELATTVLHAATDPPENLFPPAEIRIPPAYAIPCAQNPAIPEIPSLHTLRNCTLQWRLNSTPPARRAPARRAPARRAPARRAPSHRGGGDVGRGRGAVGGGGALNVVRSPRSCQRNYGERSGARPSACGVGHASGAVPTRAPSPPPTLPTCMEKCTQISGTCLRASPGSDVRTADRTYAWSGEGGLRGTAMRHLQKPATRSQNPAVSAIPSLHTLRVVLQAAPVQHTVWHFPPRAHQRVTFCRCTGGVRPSASCPYTHSSRGRAGTRGCVRARACVCTCARVHMYVGLPSKEEKTKKNARSLPVAPALAAMVSTCWAALAWDWSTSAPACAGQLGPARPNRRAGAAQPPTAG